MGLPAEALTRIFQPAQPIIIWMPTKHLGNLLVSLKSIELLEKTHPECNWFIVVDESYRSLISAAGISATVIPYPRPTISRGNLAQKAMHTARFIRAIRATQANASIAIEGDKISQRFAPLSGSKLTIGPDNHYCRRFTHKISVHHKEQHRFYDYATVVEALTGQSLNPEYPKLSPDKLAQDRVSRLLSLYLPREETPFAIFHVGATKDYKQWPMDNFALLANQLQEKGIQVILTGAGLRDKRAIEALQGLCSPAPLSVHNQLNLEELAALCQRAIFFLGNDTGPTHLCAATGTPTYAIFGPTDENRWGPVGDNVLTLRSPVPCEANCSRGRCTVNYRCMRTLTADNVQNQILKYSELSIQTAKPSNVISNSTKEVADSPPTVLHILKRYSGNYPLLNAMVSTAPGKFRTLVCYLSGQDDGKNQIGHHGVEAIYLQLPKKKINWHSYLTLTALKDLIDKQHVDLVVCQFRRTVPIGAIAARLSHRKPQVIGILHGIVGGKTGFFEKLLNLFITPWLSGWVSVSKEGLKDIKAQNWAIPDNKLFYVQNGLDFERFLSPQEKINLNTFFDNYSGNERTYIVIGRLSHKKNQENIIRAFAILCKSHPESRLLIVGKGPDEEALKQLVKDLKLEKEIIFTGYRTDIPALLQSVDVFLMPSLREGLPLALLEAMASSLPVITSDVNGIREVCENINCGWLVTPEDQKSILAALTHAAKTSKKELIKMGAQGKSHVLQNFNARNMVQGYESLYENILPLSGQSQPLVSVITPVHNQSRYLSEALISACMQTYPNLEIIVVDAGSTDDSLNIAKKIALTVDRIKIIEHEQNLGVSASRNHAISIAQGKYLAFLDSDDIWDKTKIQAEVKLLGSNPKAGLGLTAARSIDSSGNIINANLCKGRRVPTGKVSPKQLIIDRYPIITSSVMIRREAIDTSGLFNTAYTAAEDLELWSRILKNTEQAYIPDVLTSYRNHDANTVKNSLRNRENKIRFLESFLSANPAEQRSPSFSTYLHRQYLKLAKLYTQEGEQIKARAAYTKALQLKIPFFRKLKATMFKKHYLSD